MVTMVKTLLTICTLCRQERYCILFPQWLSFTTGRQTISGITQAMQMILNGMIHAFIFNKLCCSFFDTEWNYQYGGCVASMLDLQSSSPRFTFYSGHLLDLIVLGLPEFKSTATLLISQPVGSCEVGVVILLCSYY